MADKTDGFQSCIFVFELPIEVEAFVTVILITIRCAFSHNRKFVQVVVRVSELPFLVLCVGLSKVLLGEMYRRDRGKYRICTVVLDITEVSGGQS